MHYNQHIAPVVWFQIDMLSSIFDDDSKQLLIPVAFIIFGEMMLLLSCLQRQIAFFNMLAYIGIGSLSTATLLLGIITTKPLVVFGTGSVFLILAIIFIIRMWRKADLEKYIVNDRDYR
jgi:hypothetical protein